MTATVSPPAAAVARSAVGIRTSDYKRALGFYIDLPNSACNKIIFADNSDSDLSEIANCIPERLDKTVELLSFQANDHPVSYGKAYGEFRLMSHALRVSQIASPNDWIWKTTGRHICQNIESLNAQSGTQWDWVCDLHNVPYVTSGHWRGFSQMDLRLFAFRPDAMHRVVGSAWQDERSAFDAAMMYRLVMQARHDLRVRPRFPVQPEIIGISGRTGREYHGTKQRRKDSVRNAARRLVPWLWL